MLAVFESAIHHIPASRGKILQQFDRRGFFPMKEFDLIGAFSMSLISWVKGQVTYARFL